MPWIQESRCKGVWDSKESFNYLCKMVIPIRLAMVPESGYPVVVSLWFIPFENAIWCASSRNAKIIPILENNNRCGFEVAPDKPPYLGLRGQADVSLDHNRGTEILVMLIDRYLKERNAKLASWLISRSADEVGIRLAPIRCHSWNFSSRMSAEDKS